MKSLTQNELTEFSALLAGDLENGEIDKVVGLFQYNKTLYQTLGKMLKEGSMFVRLGINMVLEDLADLKPDDVQDAIPYLSPLLEDENATIRGDAADIIGNIGDKAHLDLLEPLLKDEHPQVIEVVEEAIENIKERHP